MSLLALVVAVATVITLSAPVLTLVSGLVIPLLTGLATKLEASYGTKSAVTIVLAVAAGILQSIVAGAGILTTDTLVNALVTFAAALLTFYGIYGPANTDSKLAPGFGIGPAR